MTLTAALLDRNANAWIPDAATLHFVDPPASLRLPESVRFEPGDRGVRKIEVGVARRGRAAREGARHARRRRRLRRREQPDAGARRRAASALRRPARPHQLVRRHRHARGLLPLRARRRCARRRRAHRSRPLGHAVPRRESRALEGDRATHRGVLRARPSRHRARLRVDELDLRPSPRALFRRGRHGDLDGRIRRPQTPTQLWDQLRGKQAITLAHHSAGGPVATDWSFAPDPVLEPLTEIASAHGSSEAPDSPLPIYDPVAGQLGARSARARLQAGLHRQRRFARRSSRLPAIRRAERRHRRHLDRRRHARRRSRRAARAPRLRHQRTAHHPARCAGGPSRRRDDRRRRSRTSARKQATSS